MIFNAHFWRRYFRAEFLPQINALVATLEGRLLPAFNNVEQESEKVSEETWTRFMESAGTGDEDGSEFAEAAQQAGVSHYLLLTGIRQGMLNLFAAALHHAFEQQILLFHRLEVLPREDENNDSLINATAFASRLREQGIDIASFRSWTKLEELRHVANAVKHGQGRSAKTLHSVRPDLFEDPQMGRMKFGQKQAPRVFQPLVGEDLYVSLDDLRTYQASVLQFWDELSNAMLNA